MFLSLSLLLFFIVISIWIIKDSYKWLKQGISFIPLLIFPVICIIGILVFFSSSSNRLFSNVTPREVLPLFIPIAIYILIRQSFFVKKNHIVFGSFSRVLSKQLLLIELIALVLTIGIFLLLHFLGIYKIF